MAVGQLLDGRRLPWVLDMLLPGGVVALEVWTRLWGINQGPLMGAQRWPLRAFCGFNATTNITSLMPTLPLLFALSARAEGPVQASLRLLSRHALRAVEPSILVSRQAGKPVTPIEPSSSSSQRPLKPIKPKPPGAR